MKYLKPEKDIPFGETKPLRLGHRRECPPPPPSPGSNQLRPFKKRTFHLATLSANPKTL